MSFLLEETAERLAGAQKIVFVTGAGVSQESGIPTFRGTDGLWRNYDAMKLATIDAFRENPALVWEWYNERMEGMFAASPNDGHRAVAGMEDVADVTVLTQNIDGLHQRAGSSRVLELHGSMARVRCTRCDYTGESRGLAGVPPTCGCGGLLRPDVVWFGEPLPQDVWQDAIIHAGMCDAMIIAGTSLVVSPANSLPVVAKQNGAVLVEINPEDTAMSAEMDVTVRGTSASALPGLLDALRRLRSRQ